MSGVIEASKIEVNNIKQESNRNIESLKKEMASNLEASESELKDANQIITAQKQEIKSLEEYINVLRPYINHHPVDKLPPATENQK